VAGAYSAEVAADSAIAAPAATAGLATKAGSHAHKGKNFTLLGAIFLTRPKIFPKESSRFANMPDQSPTSATQFFERIFIEKNIWTRIGAILAGNQSLKKIVITIC
jgi:hypothetical protein